MENIFMSEKIKKSSEVSECKNYIYSVSLEWGNTRPCVFVMLNPSTLNDKYKNPTIDNCTAIAKNRDCDSITAVNLFACIAADEGKLLKRKPNVADNIVGEENDKHLCFALFKPNALVIAAWGDISTGKNAFRTTEEFYKRVDYVSDIIKVVAKNKPPEDIKCLKGANPERGGLTDHPWWLLNKEGYNSKNEEEIAEEVKKRYYLTEFPL